MSSRAVSKAVWIYPTQNTKVHPILKSGTRFEVRKLLCKLRSIGRLTSLHWPYHSLRCCSSCPDHASARTFHSSVEYLWVGRPKNLRIKSLPQTKQKSHCKIWIHSTAGHSSGHEKNRLHNILRCDHQMMISPHTGFFQLPRRVFATSLLGPFDTVYIFFWTPGVPVLH